MAYRLHAYDSLYRLTNETLTSATGPSGSVSYILDPVGNCRYQRPAIGGSACIHERFRVTQCKARNSTIAGLTQQAFTYDANDRLQSDTYDANGNTKVGQVSLNSNGAEAASQTVTDTYDDQNRLVSRNGPSGQIQVVYDGDGNKGRESINGQIITYLIDTLNPTGYAQVLEELQNDTVVRTYTYGHDLLVQDQRDTGGTWSATWYGYDGHGSVRFLTNGAGQITDRYDYDAFGVLLAASGATYNRYRYCGEQFDDALGLYYFRARYMNAANGRFWTMDSYEGSGRDPSNLHKYLYCKGEPMGSWDPSGKFTIMDQTMVQWVNRTFVTTVTGAMLKGAAANVVVNFFIAEATGNQYSLREAGWDAAAGALLGGFASKVPGWTASLASKAGGSIAKLALVAGPPFANAIASTVESVLKRKLINDMDTNWDQVWTMFIWNFIGQAIVHNAEEALSHGGERLRQEGEYILEMIEKWKRGDALPGGLGSFKQRWTSLTPLGRAIAERHARILAAGEGWAVEAAIFVKDVVHGVLDEAWEDNTYKQ